LQALLSPDPCRSRSYGKYKRRAEGVRNFGSIPQLLVRVCRVDRQLISVEVDLTIGLPGSSGRSCVSKSMTSYKEDTVMMGRIGADDVGVMGGEG
jgi:hypothetical protein